MLYTSGYGNQGMHERGREERTLRKKNRAYEEVIRETMPPVQRAKGIS